MRLIDRLYEEDLDDFLIERPVDAELRKKIQIVKQKHYEVVPNIPFWINVDLKIISLFQEFQTVFGNVVKMAQGIQTGDNKRYIRRLEGANVKRSDMSLDTIKTSEISTLKSYSGDELGKFRLFGIKNEDPHYVPFIKGSPREWFLAEEFTFLDWSKDSVTRLKRAQRQSTKQSALRNPLWLFREGLIVVTAYRGIIAAKRIPLGAVQILPMVATRKEYPLISPEFLLGFLNSKLISYLNGKVIQPVLEDMNARTYSGYLKHIPFCNIDDLQLNREKFVQFIKEVENSVKNILEKLIDQNESFKPLEDNNFQELNNSIYRWYGIDGREDLINEIDEFYDQRVLLLLSQA